MSFDRLAPHYTWLEAVLAGARLQRARVAWLDRLGGCEDILIAGLGHGHFLRACARRFPSARLTGVDASRAMLVHAEGRARRTGLDLRRLRFIHAALPEWQPPPAQFDAIVTPFFLDCFPPAELAEVVAALAAAARPRTCWLVADFAVPSHGWARHRARAVHALMYAFFRRATRIAARRVTEPDALLAAHGFTLAGRKTTEWGLLRSDWWVRAEAAEPPANHANRRE